MLTKKQQRRQGNTLSSTTQNDVTPEQIADLIDWKPEDVKKLKKNGWSNQGILKANMQLFCKNAKDVENLDLWSKRYLVEGHIWGDKPSAVANFVIENALEYLPKDKKTLAGLRALDIGCGYGRDLKELAKNNLIVFGIEKAAAGISETSAALEKQLKNGTAQLILSEFNSANGSLPKNLDIIISHRMMHQEAEENVPHTIQRIFNHLAPGGLAIISARNTEDLKNPGMAKDPKDPHNPKKAIAMSRPGHVIYAWDNDTFKEHFGNAGFKIHKLIDGEEIETEGSNVMSKFTMIIAQKPEDPNP